MTLAWRQCCASARSQKSLRPFVDLVQNVHSDAIGVDPVLVRLAESAVFPICCGQHEWSTLQKDLVSKELRGGLPQLCPVNVRLQKLLVVHSKLW